MPQQYDDGLQAFATTLHYYSPHAYRYVRKTFDTCLPHPRTTQRWYQVTVCKPGFTQESMEFLRECNCRSTSKKLYSLVIDEIVIHGKSEFSADLLMDDGVTPSLNRHSAGKKRFHSFILK